ncbi:MAG: hypothetical protein NTY98_07270 [Verrucomicrobia bacterium]|nr:hypothetical protein [Verrucomicrobiota bacterium]
MYVKLRTLVLSLCLSVECAAQVSEPNAQTSAFFSELRRRTAEMKQRIKEDQMQMELAAARDNSLTALRADLTAPWTSLIIAHRQDCTCTGRWRGFCTSRGGTTYHGFRLSQAGETVTVTPWNEIEGKEHTGESRQLTKPEVERLLSETALFYLAATLSVSPWEKAGPRPSDPVKALEWRQSLLAAGGSPMPTDDFSMEVRVATPAGLKRHINLWERHEPCDFSKWVAAFGALSPR